MSEENIYKTHLFDAVHLKLSHAVTAIEWLSYEITDAEPGNKVTMAEFTLKAAMKEVRELFDFAHQHAGDILLIGNRGDNFHTAEFQPAEKQPAA